MQRIGLINIIKYIIIKNQLICAFDNELICRWLHLLMVDVSSVFKFNAVNTLL